MCQAKNVDLRGLKTINHKGDGSRAPKEKRNNPYTSMPACVLYVFVDFFQCHSRFYEALGLCASLTLVVPLAQLDWCATLSF